jgi:hypothetical protein
MRLAVLVLALIACRADAPIAPVIRPSAEPVARVTPAAPLPNRRISRLTPFELAPVVLGMTRDELLHARPTVALDPDEHYEFRLHYVEALPGMSVHYYVLHDASATYQISIDFDDETAAELMWERYRGMGALIDDLGGQEIVIDGYAFQVRAWTHGKRVQIMAVIEGSEWWNQYHAKDTLDGTHPGDGDGGTVIP